MFSVVRTVGVFSLTASICWASVGQSGLSEPVCRAQAKELAKTKYELCMKRFEQERLKSVHSNYKQRIENLKRQYENEIASIRKGQQPSAAPQRQVVRQAAPVAPPAAPMEAAAPVMSEDVSTEDMMSNTEGL